MRKSSCIRSTFTLSCYIDFNLKPVFYFLQAADIISVLIGSPSLCRQEISQLAPFHSVFCEWIHLLRKSFLFTWAEVKTDLSSTGWRFVCIYLLWVVLLHENERILRKLVQEILSDLKHVPHDLHLNRLRQSVKQTDGIVGHNGRQFDEMKSRKE